MNLLKIAIAVSMLGIVGMPTYFLWEIWRNMGVTESLVYGSAFLIGTVALGLLFLSGKLDASVEATKQILKLKTTGHVPPPSSGLINPTK